MPRSTGLQVLHPQGVDISKTRSEKVKAQEEFTAANRSVKQRITADKRNYLETLQRSGSGSLSEQN
ncbi:hypothetical protein DPMN_176361 [Dreissena polymorpha]|uniref:Uncharacterized protein n=1 Tax=Dreissena polymorpha TaxID=45954 RepID=A0A9D4IGU6_DREPO|nr:hypothetical protein DPMN_176361 [Dreissena polymorpha]